MVVTFELTAGELRRVIVAALSSQTKGLHLDWDDAKVTPTTRAGGDEAEELVARVDVRKEDE